MSSSRTGSVALGRAPSPNNPRASTSSARSRFGPEEFEAALLNPNHTVFLSGSAPIEEESAGSPRRSRGSGEYGHGRGNGNGNGNGNENGNGDTPLSIREQRSFDSDLKSPGTPNTDSTPRRAGKTPGIGIVPATPGSINTSYTRRTSVTTQESEGTQTKSRIKAPSLGLDAEIAAEQAAKSVSKRRSIFRSPGTASSPDLATLVKRARERKPIPQPPTSQSSRDPSAAGPSYSFRSAEMSPERRSGSISSGKLGTISERPKDGEDGHKSMRNKARGMLGRMFGSKEVSPSSRPFPVPPPTSTPVVPPIPPIPPIPASYVAEAEARKQAISTPEPPPIPDDDDDDDLANYPTHSLSAVPESGVATFDGSPIIENGTEDGQAWPEAPSRDVPQAGTPASRSSLHVRQPADSSEQEETPPREREKSFSEDVAGLFANIGQESPARELGLGPDTLRSKPRDDSRDLDRMKTPRELHAELGRSSSVTSSPFLDQSHLKPTPSPVPGRSSSLPSPALSQQRTPARMVSTPDPSERTPHLTPNIDDAHSFTVPGPRKTSPVIMGRALGFGPSPTTDAEGTVKSRPRSQLESPVAPSVRLVGSPRPDQVALDSASTSPRTNADVENLAEPLEIPILRTPDGNDDEDVEEKGRRLACEFLENDFSHVAEDKVAIFLGGQRAVNSFALKYYMQYFDMRGQNLVEAFRELCAKLVLKAESQEIDRIIEGFSARYHDCNPNSVFGTSGVIHTITGAMLMLNTDLHIAELSKHMSRADFIRNAMSAIRESMPDGTSTPDLIRDDESSLNNGTIRSRTPTTNAQRSASAPVAGQALARVMSDTAGKTSTGSSTTLSSFTYSKAWRVDAETALRDIYSAVRADRILLPTSTSGDSNRQSVISLNGSFDFTRRPGNRSASDRVSMLKRGSVRMSGNSPYGNLAVSSDGRLSPTGSYATSIGDAYSPFASLGFASNLSHSVIKEQEDEAHSTSSRASLSTVDELDDDELALLGAPWAKEGLLWHKLYMEAVGKRAKKNDWLQYFTVVQKGELYMFTFGSGLSGFMGGSVGGGNWLNNAKPVGTIDLMHTLASVVPKGGIADRPHCFSLTVSTGQVTLFQAGTEDLVTEWVATCNYWSARRSRQPLAGGVSNMEYGWQRVADLDHDEHDNHDKQSVRSARSNLSKFGGTYGRKSTQPMDRVHINDWRPPPAANIPSPLDEEQQLEALQAYMRSLGEELSHHRALEENMTRQYSPGSKNLAKAKDNWRARSLYLHTEIIKYTTYLDSLKSAISLRFKKAGERKLEKSLARSTTSFHRADSDNGLDRIVSESRGS